MKIFLHANYNSRMVMPERLNVQKAASILKDRVTINVTESIDMINEKGPFIEFSRTL